MKMLHNLVKHERTRGPCAHRCLTRMGGPRQTRATTRARELPPPSLGLLAHKPFMPHLDVHESSPRVLMRRTKLRRAWAGELDRPLLRRLNRTRLVVFPSLRYVVRQRIVRVWRSQ